MSIKGEIEEEQEHKRKENILREAAKILCSKYPPENVDEWGNRRYFSS